MFPAWMKAFGDGGPLKLQPAHAGEQTASNAADKIAPRIPWRTICNSVDFRYEGGEHSNSQCRSATGSIGGKFSTPTGKRSALWSGETETGGMKSSRAGVGIAPGAEEETRPSPQFSRSNADPRVAGY